MIITYDEPGITYDDHRVTYDGVFTDTSLWPVSEVERAVESFRLDLRTFERRVEITSCRSCGFLTIGEDPARLRMPGRSRVDVVTTHERTGVITETDSVFVMTEIQTIEVV